MTTAAPDLARVGFWRGCGRWFADAARLVRGAGVAVIAVALAFQVLIVLIAFPVIRWLFGEAVRASGMVALDLASLRIGGGLVISLALLIVLAVFAFWVLSLQFTTVVVMLAPESGATVRARVRAVGRVFRKLLRPSAFPLFLYLFLVLPLSGFGFTSFFLQHITIPPFVSGELMKSPGTTVALLVFLAILFVVNLRWAVALPVFALTDATGGKALRRSWRLTRGIRSLQLVVVVGALMLAAGLVIAVLLVLSVLPVMLTDAVAPDASVGVGAVSLGIAQTLVLLTSTVLSVAVSAALVALLRRHHDELPGDRARTAAVVAGPDEPAVPAPAPRSRRAAAALVGGSVVIAIGLSMTSFDALERVSTHPETLVLAHRGFTDGGVENTIGSLRAAADAGADLVEMDIMQTADGRFVVMHDTSLGRLADDPRAVRDMTLAELTQVTVHDLEGHSDLIPSLADYLAVADEVGMRLLIEIKLSGAETDDHVDMLVAELEQLGVLNDHIYHSLDAPSVARLKLLRPGLSVGYTMAFAGAGVPDTPADFIVVEEWTATEELQRQTADAGLGFMVWTVNEEDSMRALLRREVDGIITDHADTALRNRVEMGDETGLAPVIVDVFMRSLLGI